VRSAGSPATFDRVIASPSARLDRGAVLGDSSDPLERDEEADPDRHSIRHDATLEAGPAHSLRRSSGAELGDRGISERPEVGECCLGAEAHRDSAIAGR
jgi:hypothetical protein